MLNAEVLLTILAAAIALPARQVAEFDRQADWLVALAGRAVPSMNRAVFMACSRLEYSSVQIMRCRQPLDQATSFHQQA